MPSIRPVLLPMTDAEAIHRVLTGDTAAFEPLVKRYEQAVCNHLFRLLGKADQVDELAQNTFIEAYHHLGKFNTQRSFKAWLLGIAYNQARGLWRQTQRQQQRITSLDDSNLQEQPFATYDPEPEENPGNWLMPLLNRLDDRYKQALLLRFQQELSYQDVATAMNVPLNTVRTWLKRGKTQLMELAVEHGYGKDLV
jgi:RNA polymerase sigma-70 factor, ECF subfamily